MIITHNKHYFFRIQTGDTIIAVNPVHGDYDSSVSKFGATAILVNQQIPVMNGIETASYGGSEPLVIDGPGSYEFSDMFVEGFTAGKTPGGILNTGYSFTFDDMKIAVLGVLDSRDDIDNDAWEFLDGVDIVFVGIDSVDPDQEIDVSKMAGIINAVSPSVVIPMGYEKASHSAVKALAGELSLEIESTQKLTIKKRDLSTQKRYVVFE